MLRKLIFAVLLLMACFDVDAASYTDAWYVVGEEGWGTFLIQSDTFQFIAFFIFDPNGNPTWYSGQFTADALGNYSGQLYASKGTYFAVPWNPAQVQLNPIGTISFVPTDIYHATMTYALTGGPTVVKQVQRFTLTPYPFPGNYSGSMAGSISGCTNPNANDPAFRGRYILTVTGVGDQSATLAFNFVDTTHSGIACTLSGPLTHYGRLYQLNGQASCTGGGYNGAANPATVDSLLHTGQGVEGHWTGSLGGNCAASLHFSAVLNVNN